ncbi:MAG: hypothetical protein AMJ69_02145 [Gammaproteobacteria bacterium SG8_47]|nr:MAG: hypothetical protein AMJ69_02145 [Gammaproteobacteria bacterium SG8_47]
MGRLLVLIAIAVLVLLALRWFARTPPEQVRRTLRWALLWGGIGLLVLLAATGRLHWLFAVIGSALGAMAPFARRLAPFLLRMLPALPGIFAQYKRQKSAGGPSAGNSSQVTTRFLRMTLDHDSGEMDGVILEGTHQGQHLHELNLDELLALLTGYLHQDEQSAALLQAYLDRIHGEAWRERYSGGGETRSAQPPPRGTMSTAEAYEILGLEPGASEQDIIVAHRKLIQKVHPDRGGSNYLAAKINEAKDVLLNR